MRAGKRACATLFSLRLLMDRLVPNAIHAKEPAGRRPSITIGGQALRNGGGAPDCVLGLFRLAAFGEEKNERAF